MKKQARKLRRGLDICMNIYCDKKPKARGLCSACYAVALDLVHRRMTNWEQLVNEGKCASKQHGRRFNWFNIPPGKEFFQ